MTDVSDLARNWKPLELSRADEQIIDDDAVQRSLRADYTTPAYPDPGSSPELDAALNAAYRTFCAHERRPTWRWFIYKLTRENTFITLRLARLEAERASLSTK